MVAPAFAILILGILILYFWNFLFSVEYPVSSESHSAIIISGCSSGVGYHSAVFLGSKGYVVYAGVRKISEFSLFDNTTNVVPVLLDVTNISTILNAKQFIVDDLKVRSGNISLIGVVNNAAIGFLCAVEEIKIDLLRDVMEVNLFGALNMIQAFLPMLQTSKGSRIVNIGSVAGFLSSPLFGSYGASKFALSALTDSLRIELYMDNISVSIIDPGTILDTKIRSKRLVSKETTANTSNIKKISRFEQFYSFTRQRYANVEKHRIGDPPEIVSEAIFHALNSRYPKSRYVVGRIGKNSAWFLYFANLFLPTRIMDKILLNTMNKL